VRAKGAVTTASSQPRACLRRGSDSGGRACVCGKSQRPRTHVRARALRRSARGGGSARQQRAPSARRAAAPVAWGAPRRLLRHAARARAHATNTLPTQKPAHACAAHAPHTQHTRHAVRTPTRARPRRRRACPACAAAPRRRRRRRRGGRRRRRPLTQTWRAARPAPRAPPAQGRSGARRGGRAAARPAAARRGGRRAAAGGARRAPPRPRARGRAAAATQTLSEEAARRPSGCRGGARSWCAACQRTPPRPSSCQRGGHRRWRRPRCAAFDDGQMDAPRARARCCVRRLCLRRPRQTPARCARGARALAAAPGRAPTRRQQARSDGSFSAAQRVPPRREGPTWLCRPSRPHRARSSTDPPLAFPPAPRRPATHATQPAPHGCDALAPRTRPQRRARCATLVGPFCAGLAPLGNANANAPRCRPSPRRRPPRAAASPRARARPARVAPPRAAARLPGRPQRLASARRSGLTRALSFGCRSPPRAARVTQRKSDSVARATPPRALTVARPSLPGARPRGARRATRRRFCCSRALFTAPRTFLRFSARALPLR
jgi:hypothetical protein